MYILESKDQNKGIEVMVRWPEMTKTMVASQKIEHELRAWEAVWVGAILVAQVGEIWGKPVRLQGGSTHTLEMYDGVLT